MCNEIKKCKTIRCAKKQYDVQKTIGCAKDNRMCKKDVQKKTKKKTIIIRCAKNNKMYKKRKPVYWDLINSNVNKRDVQTVVQGIVHSSNDENVIIFTVN